MSEKPSGLPGEKKSLKKEDPNKPKSLPEIQASAHLTAEDNLRNNINANRMCPTCKKEARIVSNFNGVNAFCGPCKTHWPIASSALMPPSPLAPARGFHKTTLTDPDWSIAFDRDVGEQK